MAVSTREEVAKETNQANAPPVETKNDTKYSLDVDTFLTLKDDKGEEYRYHNVINEQQRFKLNFDFQAYKQGKRNFAVSKDGCVIIPLSDMGSGSHVDNIAFVTEDGQLDRVYKLQLKDGQDNKYATDTVIYLEKRGTEYDKERISFENIFGEGTLRRFSTGLLRDNQGFVRQSERREVGTNGKNNERVSNRNGDTERSEKGGSDVKLSAVPTMDSEGRDLAKENCKLKKDLADSYKEINKWKDEIKMIPSRLDYSVSAKRRLSTLREAHRDAALGLTTFSKADKIVAKSEGIILLPKGSAVCKDAL